MKAFIMIDLFYVYFAPLVNMDVIFSISHTKQSYLLLFFLLQLLWFSSFSLRSLISFFVSVLLGWSKPYQLGTTERPFCYTITYIEKVGIFSLRDFMEQRCVGRRAVTLVCECREEFTLPEKGRSFKYCLGFKSSEVCFLFSAQTSVRRMTVSLPLHD